MPLRHHQHTTPIPEHTPESTTLAPRDISRPAADGEVTAECAVCPHPWTFHDRIAARYCTATIAGQSSRGCVCTPYLEGAAHHKRDKDSR